MSDLLRQMVNEAETPEDYQSACAMVRHHIQAGREVDWTLLQSLAVKGHVIAAATGQTITSRDFVRTYQAEPGTMVNTS